MVTQGDSLEPRDSHVTMTHNNRFLVIYGGISNSKEDHLLAIVDSLTGEIRNLKRSELLFFPPFLESHSCTLIRGDYYIYGGSIQENSEKTSNNEQQTDSPRSESSECGTSQNQLYRV